MKKDMQEDNSFQPKMSHKSREIVGKRYQPGQYMRGKNVRRSLGYSVKPYASKIPQLHDQELKSKNNKL